MSHVLTTYSLLNNNQNFYYTDEKGSWVCLFFLFFFFWVLKQTIWGMKKAYGAEKQKG